MPKLVLKTLKLLKNFDILFGGKNEIYLRCICWFGNDISTAQLYPDQKVIAEDFLAKEPIISASKNETIFFNKLFNNDLGLILLNKNISQIQNDLDKEDKIIEIKDKQLQNLKDDLDKLRKILSPDIIEIKEKILKYNEKIYETDKKINLIANNIANEIEKIKINQEVIDDLKNIKEERPLKLENIKFQNNIDDLNEENKKLLSIKRDIRTHIKLLEDNIRFSIPLSSEKVLEQIDKISSKNIEIIEAKHALNNLIKQLELLQSDKLNIKYIIQVLENDEKIRQIGNNLNEIIQFTKNITNPWIAIREAEHNAEMVRLLHDAEKEAFPDDFVDFNPESIVSPTVYTRGYINFITASISFIGNILQANKDDVVCTKVGTISTKNKDVLIKEEGKCELTLTLITDKESSIDISDLEEKHSLKRFRVPLSEFEGEEKDFDISLY